MSTSVVTLEIFNSLKAGQVVAVRWRSCSSNPREAVMCTVGRRSHSKKFGYDKITLNPHGVRIIPTLNQVSIYKRANGDISEALGDMAVTITSLVVQE